MKFTLLTTDTSTKARAGVIETDHGTIHTPIFMPVGTAGSVKAVHQRELENDIGAEIILGNTYHLYLRPGIELLEKTHGIHGFNGWNKPVLTDSGGYQVYSLGENRKITEEGVVFKSHIDGSRHTFTPENVMDIQRSIGADIIMAFDECTPYPCSYQYAKESMEMTHRWLTRCIQRIDSTPSKYNHSQALFPIVQGSIYKDLRVQSAEFIAAQEQQGNAIGGLSVGEPHDVMLPRQAVELLNYRQGLDKVFVFPSRIPGQPVAQKALGLAQYTARHADPESGVKDPIEVPWTVHDLRRTVATGLAKLGCPRVVQDRILNHVDNSVAAIYDRHRYNDEARAWLQKWADQLDALTVRNVVAISAAKAA